MYSMDKYGKLKKQIDRYFLPLEINPNLIIDAIRLEEKKNVSPNKARQQTLARMAEEAKKFELLRITGKELGNNFIPIGTKTPKTRATPRDGKVSPHKKQLYRYKIQQILKEPISSLVQIIKRDKDSHLFTRQLEELSKFKVTSFSENQLKTSKTLYNGASIETIQVEHFQNVILSNPTLYKKLIQLHQQEKIGKEKIQKFSLQKRATMVDGLPSRKLTGTFKKFQIIDNNMAPHELKKFSNFVQYRQFLLVINLSNGIIVNPDQECQNKAYICKGNNGLLVKSIMKTRPWWCLRSSSDIDNCALVWTEWKKTKMLKNLPGKIQASISSHDFSPAQIPEKSSSFYVNNYYERITNSNSNRLQNNLQKIRPTSILLPSKTEEAISPKVPPSQENIELRVNNKRDQIKKLGNIESFITDNLILEDGNQRNYFTFTQKINEKRFEEFSKKYINSQGLSLSYSTISSPMIKSKEIKSGNRIMNHLPGCLHLHSKKSLFLNMKKYYEKSNRNAFDFLPQTYLVTTKNEDDHNLIKFAQKWERYEQDKIKNKCKNIWICKPGENSNRGNGISVVQTLEQIKGLIRNKTMGNRTLIIQKYMENPYLFKNRKFDIRCYILMTTVNGILKGYFYDEGYLRTTSKEFSLKNLDNKFIHLTNDAVQKKGEQYGKFQNCNKVSFAQFEKYLESCSAEDVSKFAEAREKIKKISTELILATSQKLNPERKQFCFEVIVKFMQLYGLDYMLDAKMQPFLIEANSNPCLEVDGPVLSKIIPPLIENTIRVAIDPLFPPPYSQNWKSSRFSPGNPFQQNKFELIYDSIMDTRAKQQWEDCRELAEDEQDLELDQENEFE